MSADSSLATREASPAPLTRKSATWLIGLSRIGLGWTLAWAGLDKLFGLGHATPPEGAVIRGASVTAGYLGHGLNPEGPAYGILGPLAGSPIVDALFLTGLLGCGIALLLGVVMRIACIGGAVLFMSLWFSQLPLENNPFWDEHTAYALGCLLMLALGGGRYLGFGQWWSNTDLVRRLPVLA